MKNEREQESINREPIQVKLGEEFKPFGAIEDFNNLETEKFVEGSYFYSNPFHVEEIGYGKAIIAPISEFPIGGRFLDLSSDTVKITELERLGRIQADIYQFDPTVKTQPDITCTVKIERLELHANNERLLESIEDSALFYSFYSKEHLVEDALIIDASLKNLKKLIFRFDPNPNPS